MHFNSGKICLILEAFFSGFYVTITRSFFIIMLSYSGYNLSTIGYVVLTSSLLGLALSYYIYSKSYTLYKNVKFKLLILHGLERLFWLLLPFSIPYPQMLALIYSIALAITIPVGILINLVIYSNFSEIEIPKIVSQRFVFSSITSILGAIFGYLLVYSVGGVEIYTLMYILAGFVGFLSTFSLIPIKLPEKIQEEFKEKIFEVEIRRVNVFTFLFLYSAAYGILSIAWIPYLKNVLNLSQNIVASMSIAFACGGVLGSYLCKNMLGIRVSILINVLLVLLIPFLKNPYIHILLAILLSSTSVSGYIFANIVYSRYSTYIGIVKTSTLLTSCYALGLLLSSLISIFISNYFTIFISSSILYLIAIIIAMFAIPEVSIVKPSQVLDYARLVYSISLTGYVYTIVITKETTYLLIRVFAITIALILIYLTYRVAYILLTI